MSTTTEHEALANGREGGGAASSASSSAHSCGGWNSTGDESHCFMRPESPDGARGGVRPSAHYGARLSNMGKRLLAGRAKTAVRGSPYVNVGLNQALGEKQGEGKEEHGEEVYCNPKAPLRARPPDVQRYRQAYSARYGRSAEGKLIEVNEPRTPPHGAAFPRHLSGPCCSGRPHLAMVSCSGDNRGGVNRAEAIRHYGSTARRGEGVAQVDPFTMSAETLGSTPELSPPWSMGVHIETPTEAVHPNAPQRPRPDTVEIAPDVPVCVALPLLSCPRQNSILRGQTHDYGVLLHEDKERSQGGKDPSQQLVSSSTAPQLSMKDTEDDSVGDPSPTTLPSLSKAVIAWSANINKTETQMQGLTAGRGSPTCLSGMRQGTPLTLHEVTEEIATEEAERVASGSRMSGTSEEKTPNLCILSSAIWSRRRSELRGELISTEERPQKKKRKGSRWAKSLLRRALAFPVMEKSDGNGGGGGGGSVVGSISTSHTLTGNCVDNKNIDGNFILPQPPRTSLLAYNLGHGMETRPSVRALPSTSRRSSAMQQNPDPSLASSNMLFFSPSGRRRYDAAAFKSVLSTPSNHPPGVDPAGARAMSRRSTRTSRDWVSSGANDAAPSGRGNSSDDGGEARRAAKSQEPRLPRDPSLRSDLRSDSVCTTRDFIPLRPFTNSHSGNSTTGSIYSMVPAEDSDSERFSMASFTW
ncbi:uncharacterized protein Tco025E_00315 [Trypanosoma conorhini]|uniref:Uncharacterized protein n=1 Tax=Trypanosoma conorhini TaxID=83891 RepID=A0A3R7P1Q1_9TRYP|nr:uncharacterized protein Tco025E_00315 [Trypanosoma conorhini]RNF27453.1 hypothetical protein Tco025E_00315 [Trypanosoma conorhini]